MHMNKTHFTHTEDINVFNFYIFESKQSIGKNIFGMAL